MFNIILNKENNGYLFQKGNKIRMECKIEEYLNNICIINGSTFNGHCNASKKLLPNNKKLPIYISTIDDYIIPLASPDSYDCIWISANNYLTCFVSDEITYIKFKDKSEHAISFSLYTIKQQYKKYQELDQKRNDLKRAYERNKIIQ